MTKVTVIIPAANEARNIRTLIEEVLETAQVDVIVVDNGSTDDTAHEAALAGANVISEPQRGYGRACAAGVVEAGDTDVLVFLDGDHSFSPTDLPVLTTPIIEDQADLVLGSRKLGPMERRAMPPQQRFGNWLGTRLVNTLYGLSITDLGPYRAIRKGLLLELNMQEMTYGWPTEMIVKAARRKARISEVPVSYQSRRFGRSKVSGTFRGALLAGYYILGVIFRYAWKI